MLARQQKASGARVAIEANDTFPFLFHASPVRLARACDDRGPFSQSKNKLAVHLCGTPHVTSIRTIYVGCLICAMNIRDHPRFVSRQLGQAAERGFVL